MSPQPEVPVVPSLSEIKASIPGELFRPSLAKSLRYVAWDVVVIALLFQTTHFLVSKYTLGFLALPVYWFLQGTMMWGVFVLGHDCGHGSFSKYPLVNSVFGNLLHTFILVPYEMWRLSHRHHHKNTGNIDKDEIFYPVRSEHSHNSVWLAKNIYFGLGLGWFGYLFAGYNPRPASHLNPWNPLFAVHIGQSIASLLLWLGWLGTLLTYAIYYGQYAFVLNYYAAPLFVFASWLVVVTFLHHADAGVVTWYSNDNWSYVLGNLESVDRDYGMLHWITHSIGTHQVHHLFPAVPHYNLQEATKHFRKKYPHLIRESKEPIMTAFARNFKAFASQQIIGDKDLLHKYEHKEHTRKAA